MVVRLVNQNGKDLVASRNPGLSPLSSPPDQLIRSRWLGDFFFFFSLIQDQVHGLQEEFIFKLDQDTGVVACF